MSYVLEKLVAYFITYTATSAWLLLLPFGAVKLFIQIYIHNLVVFAFEQFSGTNITICESEMELCATLITAIIFFKSIL